MSGENVECLSCARLIDEVDRLRGELDAVAGLLAHLYRDLRRWKINGEPVIGLTIELYEPYDDILASAELNRREGSERFRDNFQRHLSRDALDG